MIQVCRDTSDAAALYLPQRLYLKPFAKLNISVQLPPSKVHGKSLSNWELMEKIRKIAQPESFSALKVTKHSTEVIRFEAEMESQSTVHNVIQRLNDRVVQLTNYPGQLKLKVTEAKADFPSRHSWDSFFRDAPDMDEMKPGERPDTVHICNLPIRWFVHDRDRDEDAQPSESLFKRVFEKFGSIRQVDVPVADPYRMQMKSMMRGITTPPQDAALYFEGYIQFSEYVGFVRCMDALRGKKLLRKREGLAEWCPMQVDFDKTKHMTDAAVKRRAIVRERLTSRQRAKDELEREIKDKVARREARDRLKSEHAEQEKLVKMREREERRKKKNLAKLMERDDVDLNGRVAEEQKKLLKAQKKLQAVRLIEELFKRIELRPELQGSSRERYYTAAGERSARSRVVERVKRQHQAAVDDQRNQLKCALDGRIVIRSALETKKAKRDSSADSLSSEERHERDHKRVKSERLTTPEREMEYNKAAAAGLYGLPPPYQFGYPAFGMPQPAYPYPPQNPMYYAVRGNYYPPPADYARRGGGGGRGRGRGRGRPRMPYFDGPDASHQYYKYFKKLSETESRNDHDDRRSRSRSRSRRRSYTRSRSRSRRRSYTRSRSRSRSRRRSRSRSRRSRSRSRRSRSRSRRSRSHTSRSRSHSRKRSKSHRRSKSKTPPRNGNTDTQNGVPSISPKPRTISPQPRPRTRSKSWDLPKAGDQRKSWSKSPKKD